MMKKTHPCKFLTKYPTISTETFKTFQRARMDSKRRKKLNEKMIKQIFLSLIIKILMY